MAMKPLMLAILVECARREDRLKNGPPPPGRDFGLSAAEGYRQAGIQIDFEEQKRCGPRWNAGDWGLGGSGAERKAALRAVHAL
jgi:hypothetical protein